MLYETGDGEEKTNTQREWKFSGEKKAYIYMYMHKH